jgi:hypothetical protein
MEGTMLQSLAVPLTGSVSVATPAWDKAAGQRRTTTPRFDWLGWLGAAALTVLVTAGVVALLVAEYAVLWALLVAPWLDTVRAALPWPL